MKEFIQTVIYILLVVAIFGFITSLIGQAFVYSDEVKARRLEYCISQNQTYKNCYIMVYRGYDFNKIIKKDLETIE